MNNIISDNLLSEILDVDVTIVDIDKTKKKLGVKESELICKCDKDRLQKINMFEILALCKVWLIRQNYEINIDYRRTNPILCKVQVEILNEDDLIVGHQVTSECEFEAIIEICEMVNSTNNKLTECKRIGDLKAEMKEASGRSYVCNIESFNFSGVISTVNGIEVQISEEDAELIIEDWCKYHKLYY